MIHAGTMRDAIFSAVVPAPFGAIGIRSDGGQVLELVYLPAHCSEKPPTDAVAEQCASQLSLYFREPDFRFELPLAQVGTDFQRRVWQVIASIPRGEVKTYGQVARMLNSAPRAVGQACGANWFPMVIPCHRVTAAGGLGGFSNHDDASGFHVGVKRWLLAHEGLSQW